MDLSGKKKGHQFYVPWYAGDPHDDSWIGYLYRNLHHIEGEEVPFNDSSWNYPQDDAFIHDEVLGTLYKSNDIDSSMISVLVNNKSVTLSGVVRSLSEKTRATEIVSSVPNIWFIHNELIIENQ